jgi:glycosyltransferase involved in cell wall biosynthesis
VLNLFYQEPDSDRWLPYDRYPRRAIRYIVDHLYRGTQPPGGQRMVYRNLKKGLDRLDIPYRDNDFRYIRKHPGELACIVGKPNVLDDYDWKNPILFGASVFSHPLDCPDLFERYPVRKMLVPGPWMREMFESHYDDDKIEAWPVGIDTGKWKPTNGEKDVDVFIYDKVLWGREEREKTLTQPIRDALERRGMSFEELRNGSYKPPDLADKLAHCKACIFLCEHETQGIAYQQMLASSVPLFAWDRGGQWLDPEYYPDQVQFGPVSSVPYWDERCGMTFEDADAFDEHFDTFWERVEADAFEPRAYILENLTLEKCAQQYVDIAECVASDLPDQVS